MEQEDRSPLMNGVGGSICILTAIAVVDRYDCRQVNIEDDEWVGWIDDRA